MSIGQHHKGVSGGFPLSPNQISDANKSTNDKAGSPVDEQLKISYGAIAEVDYEGSRVRIDVLTRGQKLEKLGKIGDLNSGIWVPIIQPLPVIHMLYGALRPGLTVRIFWRGKNDPGSDAVAEVISEKTLLEFITGSEKPRSNELATGPSKMFLGGHIKP